MSLRRVLAGMADREHLLDAENFTLHGTSPRGPSCVSTSTAINAALRHREMER